MFLFLFIQFVLLLILAALACGLEDDSIEGIVEVGDESSPNLDDIIDDELVLDDAENSGIIAERGGR